MIGRRPQGRHARRTGAAPLPPAPGWPHQSPAGFGVPGAVTLPAPVPTPAAVPAEPRAPVVQLVFRDDSTLLLAPDDPLARALHAVAAVLVGPHW